MTTTIDGQARVDSRATAALADADPRVASAWWAVQEASSGDPLPVGLEAGERPAADVEVMAGAVAAAEFALAMRLHVALVGGALPLTSGGGMLAARGWSRGTARRVARCGALAATHPSVAGAWAAGIVTSEHLDPIARRVERFSEQEMGVLLGELAPLWGQLSPAAVERFVAAADRLLHPAPDPTPDEADAHAARDLSFAVLGDSVVLAGTLPRIEGEVVMAAIDAVAERLRSTADHVPAGARRADALVQLVNEAHAAGALPTRGGLPVALSVTLEHTGAGDAVWSTSRGHLLTEAEARWAGCDAAVTPILIGDSCQEPREQVVPSPGQPQGDDASGSASACANGQPRPADRLAALAATMFATRIPLAEGRTARTATPAQRRALAVRDRGCVIPGCGVPAEAAQVHHLTEWAEGGATDIANLATLCWGHHRQVDLHMWILTPLPPDADPPPAPEPGAAPGAVWPGNNGAPFAVTRTPRHTWRL